MKKAFLLLIRALVFRKNHRMCYFIQLHLDLLSFEFCCKCLFSSMVNLTLSISFFKVGFILLSIGLQVPNKKGGRLSSQSQVSTSEGGALGPTGRLWLFLLELRSSQKGVPLPPACLQGFGLSLERSTRIQLPMKTLRADRPTALVLDSELAGPGEKRFAIYNGCKYLSKI